MYEREIIMALDRAERRARRAVVPRDYRKDLWIAVAVATAGSDNCVRLSTPAAFADAALAEFDQRFPA